MHVYRSGARVAVHATAKVNLFFEVLGKRDDGFHEIETLMVPISLCDSLSFCPDPSGRISLECQWADPSATAALGALPAEADNLATKAARLLRERAGIEAGAALRLVKRIPAAAGLGGGSSDAAAALVAGNIAWGLNWPLERLMPLAAELGSDVPFFLGRGAAICRGRGEIVVPVGPLGNLHGVVVRPPVGLSTAVVYRHCRPGRPPRQLGPLVGALRRGDRRQLGAQLHNRLEEAAVDLSPWVVRLREEFGRLDCVAAQMSGSGTSYFAICHHARHARRTADRLRSRRLGRVYPVRL